MLPASHGPCFFCVGPEWPRTNPQIWSALVVTVTGLESAPSYTQCLTQKTLSLLEAGNSYVEHDYIMMLS